MYVTGNILPIVRIAKIMILILDSCQVIVITHVITVVRLVVLLVSFGHIAPG